jgi:chromosome segregation ATPase
MAPELIIAAVSASCAVLLVVGSLVVGRATAEMAFRRKRLELQATLASLRDRLQEESTKADAARAEAESLRLDADERVSQALGAEMAKSENSEQSLEDLRAKLAETEAKLVKAETVADDADKEFSIVRDKLDQTEKRLAEANRRLAAADGEASDGDQSEKVAALEQELQAAKKSAAKLAIVESERDQALKRIREMDKQPNESARIRTLEERVKTAEAAAAKLTAELRTRDERIESLSSSSKDQGEVDKLQEELASANERLVVSERVMEGVRARSNMLSQELKRVKAELAASKA